MKLETVKLHAKEHKSFTCNSKSHKLKLYAMRYATNFHLKTSKHTEQSPVKH